MSKLYSKYFIGVFILCQTLIAISIGLLFLYISEKDHIAPGIYIGEVDVGRMSKEEVAKEVKQSYDDVVKNKTLTIRVNGKEEYKIQYADIDAYLDTTSTVDAAFATEGMDALATLIKANFSFSKQVIHPKVVMNENKLREKLKEFSSLIDREPVNAKIYLKDGKVIKKPETNGLKLNIDRAVNRIKSESQTVLNNIIEFRESANSEIQVIVPEHIYKDFDGVDEIISEYSTDIKAAGDEDSIPKAVYAVNKFLLFPEDKKNGGAAGEFSFNENMAQINGLTEQNNEGYNQVVSTLYAAILAAGVRPDAINRIPHKTVVDYIDPGLDATVLGKKVDFRFKNTLEHTLVIFAAIKDNKVTVYITGKRQNSVTKRTIKTEIEQKYDPSVINVENRELKSGEKKMIDPGKQGVKVKVYAVVYNHDVEVEKKLLYSDKYNPIEAVVQIGPDTKWDNGFVK